MFTCKLPPNALSNFQPLYPVTDARCPPKFIYSDADIGTSPNGKFRAPACTSVSGCQIGISQANCVANHPNATIVSDPYCAERCSQDSPLCYADVSACSGAFATPPLNSALFTPVETIMTFNNGDGRCIFRHKTIANNILTNSDASALVELKNECQTRGGTFFLPSRFIKGQMATQSTCESGTQECVEIPLVKSHLGATSAECKSMEGCEV